MAIIVACLSVRVIDSITARQAYVVTDAPVRKAMADAPGSPRY